MAKVAPIVLASLVTITSVDVSNAQVSDYHRLTGTWTNSDNLSAGKNRGFVIDDHRNVYSRNNGLSGRVTESTRWGSNFIFEGEFSGGSFVCAYDITFGDDHRSAQFGIVHKAPESTPCPDGNFTRSLN